MTKKTKKGKKLALKVKTVRQISSDLTKDQLKNVGGGMDCPQSGGTRTAKPYG